MDKFFTTLPAALMCASTFVFAESSAYDCWVGSVAGVQSMQLIRCIADRDDLQQVAQSTAPYDPLIDAVHSYLHAGSIPDAERLVKTNPTVFHEGGVVNIMLYAYPTEWSWENLLPQALVQSALCRLHLDCPVHIHRMVTAPLVTVATRSKRR